VNDALLGSSHEGEEEEEEEEEESLFKEEDKRLFKADVNEDDPERDRATQV